MTFLRWPVLQNLSYTLTNDDTNIILTADTIKSINSQLNDLIDKLLAWVSANGMALNLKKLNILYSQDHVPLTCRTLQSFLILP